MTAFEKVAKYDAEHGTNFTVMIGDKIANPYGITITVYFTAYC